MNPDDTTELRQGQIELLENIRELLLRLEDEGPLDDQIRVMRLRVDREIEELH